jgi:hypothetical protein
MAESLSPNVRTRARGVPRSRIPGLLACRIEERIAACEALRLDQRDAFIQPRSN